MIFLELIKRFFSLFSENKITQASAALSYYLTMTFFPLLIIIYSFLEESQERFEQLLVLFESLLSAKLIDFIREFLVYLDSGDPRLMLPLGLSLLVGYASAGLRCIQNTISGIQGGSEYSGLKAFTFSFVYCFALLAISYFALIIMLSGPGLLERMLLLLPGLSGIFALLPLRFAFLAAVLFLILLGIYHVPKREQDKYRVIPGAAATSISVLFVSPVFSFVMNRSIKYSTVYGTITSVILLMLWLYMCCVLVYSGAILNVAIYETKRN